MKYYLIGKSNYLRGHLEKNSNQSEILNTEKSVFQLVKCINIKEYNIYISFYK